MFFMCYTLVTIVEEMIKMKKLFINLEIKKFTKLANKDESVLFTSGNEIDYIYNKKTGKRYYPKRTLIVER